MASKLKRDQLPSKEVKNWKSNLEKESKLTFNLNVQPIILQKETYKVLTGDDENRVRVYLGLEPEPKGGKYQLCAFAVSAFLLGSGDVYADYETPVYKLGEKNVDYSDNTKEVIARIQQYRKWRAGELDEKDAGAPYRQYIYPNGYLLTKFELHELFNTQGKSEIRIQFGISKTMNVMLSPLPSAAMLRSEGGGGDEDEVFDMSDLCPPDCDKTSPYNSIL